MKLLKNPVNDGALSIANDTDLSQIDAALRQQIAQAEIIELHFPKFTDGRAFSQAVLLRRRFQFQGALRATGEVLIDQLAQMQRSGFSEALLRADQDVQVAEQQLARYPAFYQGDYLEPKPLFARPAKGQTA